MKTIKTVMPLALLALSSNAFAKDIRVITPDDIRVIELKRNLTITDPLLGVELLQPRPEMGVYTFEEKKMRQLITTVEEDNDPVTSAALRELLGKSVKVKGVNPVESIAGSQDLAASGRTTINSAKQK